jgi:hypothetical protein
MRLPSDRKRPTSPLLATLFAGGFGADIDDLYGSIVDEPFPREIQHIAA